MNARTFFVAAVAVVLAAPPSRAQDISYEVAFPNAVHHEARIAVTFSGVPPGPLVVRMSRSSPGRYALHEFAKNVYAVEATDGRGRALDITRPDPHAWSVHGHDGTVTIRYTVYADRADGTYSGIDATHAHLNMPATFLYAPELGHRPIRIAFLVPEDADWRVATQLVPTDEPFTFSAPDLYYFLDSPTELSAFDIREWVEESNGVEYTIRIVLHHLGSAADLDAYADMAKKVVSEQEAVFGELPAFDFGSYTFIADYLPWAYGDGMEHRNSTILTSSAPLAANPLGRLATLSHEFFHAWNVERIRPRSLEPFQFDRANMSDVLWFAEGFTSYYDDLIIRRAGLFDDSAYFAGLGGGISDVVNGNGRRFFSPLEMSMRAPFVDAGVSNDPTNYANTFISYYTWGSVLGLALDLTLRSRFPGITLDDYMRAMWVRHGKTEQPYTLEDLRVVLGEVTGDRTFADEFFDRYVAGREVPDLAELLAHAGALVRTAHPGEPTLGPASFDFSDGGAVVTTNTLIDTPWYDAGVDRGDVVVSLAGTPIDAAETVARIIAAHRPGDTAEIVFDQRGTKRTADITFIEDPRLEVVPYEQAGMTVTEAIRSFREGWLGSRVR